MWGERADKGSDTDNNTKIRTIEIKGLTADNKEQHLKVRFAQVLLWPRSGLLQLARGTLMSLGIESANVQCDVQMTVFVKLVQYI